eukprot:1390928-Prymnesium_polylepis.1
MEGAMLRPLALAAALTSSAVRSAPRGTPSRPARRGQRRRPAVRARAWVRGGAEATGGGPQLAGVGRHRPNRLGSRQSKP